MYAGEFDVCAVKLRVDESGEMGKDNVVGLLDVLDTTVKSPPCFDWCEDMRFVIELIRLIRNESQFEVYR